MTLSLLSPSAHERLLALVDEFRAHGGRLALDTNYRPKGWPEPGVARNRIASVAARADIALPTLDDERALYGDRDAAECIARMRSLGAGEVVVKLGSRGAAVAAGPDVLTVPSTEVEVVDSTGAGDAFDAGYLHARLTGSEPPAAAAAGNELAAAALAHRGGIAPEPAGDRA